MRVDLTDVVVLYKSVVHAFAWHHGRRPTDYRANRSVDCCETLICFRYVKRVAMNDCGVSGRPTELVYPGDTDLTSYAFRFLTVVRMKYLCDNDDAER